MIADPGYRARTHLSTYMAMGGWVIQGVISDPPDLSAVHITVAAVEDVGSLMLRDAAGRMTSYNLSTAETALGVPNSFVSVFPPAEHVADDTHNGATIVVVGVNTPSNGIYTAEIDGSDDYTFVATDYSRAGELLHADVDQYSHPHIYRFTVANPSPWLNEFEPLDVNSDTLVTAKDALEVINYINAGFPTAVPLGADVGPPFYDANADFFVTARDALNIINAINAGVSLSEWSLDTVNTDRLRLLAMVEQGQGPSGVNSGYEFQDLMGILAFDLAENTQRRNRR